MATSVSDVEKSKRDGQAGNAANGAAEYAAASGATGQHDTEVRKAMLALGTAHRENYRDLVAYARSRVGSQANAQDVVQQAFVNTLAAIERGVQINYMPGYLQRSVSNLCISYSRRDQPESIEGQLHRIGQTGKSAEESAEIHEQLHDIDLVLDEMPRSQRYAFLQAELRGIEQKEIAQEMNRSIGSVRQLVSRARLKVKTRVAPGRVAGWWWPFSRLRKKDRREKRRGSFAFAGIQLATLGSWLTRVFQASANTLLQPQTPIALAVIVFVLAGGLIASPGAKDTSPAVSSNIDQSSHATSDSQKYVAVFPSRPADSATAASAGDSADSLYIDSSSGPYTSGSATINTAVQESRDSADAKTGNTLTSPLDINITDPAPTPAEPPATDPQTPDPGQTTPVPTVPGETAPPCAVADADCDGIPDSPPAPDTDGDGLPG